MSEAETLETLTAIGSASGSYITMIISFTFAYLTVAYFVGKDLSRFQCAAVTGLYIIGATLSGSAAVGYADLWVRLHDREPTIADEVWLFSTLGWVEILMVLQISVLFVSIYFMYDVRRSKRV